MSDKNVGIVGYGAYVPRFRIAVEEISRIWGEDPKAIRNGLGISEKSVPDMDEDTVTISVEAGRNALLRAGVDPAKIGAIYIGSESHPYAVKPSGTVVAEALGIGPNFTCADLEFACKAGTAGMQICYSHVKSGFADYGLAIGADTSQGRPGDALEYSAAAGGAAFVIGKDPLATIDATCSYTSDTSDFWRREGQDYPSHGARFTGKPAYFKHVISATKLMMDKVSMEAKDFDYAVLHMPNGKFPARAAKMLGFNMEQMEQGLVVKKIGNCYSGSSPLGLSAVLDIAKPGDRIIMTSYGSGAGSDSFVMTVTDKILERRDLAPKTDDYINRKENIDYGTYVKLRRKLKLGG
ncbi:MAG: hydroxymethylglutaryl-CoA synthase [Candidatus Aenigmatarchaeota archaeon]|nr:MAG: hydroxymethylglutaryl-CoA synthase [Candidatus Aenigmarchaeota archaeon]